MKLIQDGVYTRNDVHHVFLFSYLTIYGYQNKSEIIVKRDDKHMLPHTLFSFFSLFFF
jgi:hypothetical protein